MKIVMGELNGIRLLDLMNASTAHCSRVTAAVAYATSNNPFFEHCRDNKLFLDFYGLLDEDEAVAIPVLERFLQDGPLAVNCRYQRSFSLEDNLVARLGGLHRFCKFDAQSLV